jgi:hypothetical protein
MELRRVESRVSDNRRPRRRRYPRTSNLWRRLLLSPPLLLPRMRLL